jgi:ketosteroid isomerase-like protein
MVQVNDAHRRVSAQPGPRDLLLGWGGLVMMRKRPTAQRREGNVRRWGVWLAGCIVAAGCLTARSTAAGDDVADQVLQRDEEMSHAVVSGDWSRLEDIYADDYVYVGSDGRPITRAERLVAFRSGVLRYLGTKHTGVTVRLYGETAVVQGQTHSKVELNGRTLEGDFRYVGVWVRQGGRWRIVLTQATRISG